MVLLLTTILLFQKTFTKELVSVTLALLVEKLSSMDLENWFVVSEKSGFFMLMTLAPTMLL